jgi:protease PrsW
MTELLITVLLLTLAIGPAVFWMWYFYHKDRYEPEPLSWIMKIFLLGALISIPIAVSEGILRIFISEFALVVMVGPFIEECGKFFVVKKYIYQNREFNEPADGIVYAVAAALGFASVENIFYIMVIPLTDISTLFWVVFLRAILSVPGHALFSSITGYSMGLATFENSRYGQKIIFAGLAGAIACHALFNYLLTDSIGLAILLLVAIPFFWWFFQRNIRDALGKSPFRKY